MYKTAVYKPSNLKKLIISFIKLFLLFLFVKFTTSCAYNEKNSNENTSIIINYLYALEKLYYENLFINREIYSLSMLKTYFLENLKNSGIDVAFKNTVYKFFEDPFLEVKEKEIYESYYYQNRKVEDDIEIKKMFFDDYNLKICYLKLKNLSPNMAKKYREYLKKEIKEEDLVVIDLTGNMGGSLWSAAFLASMFLKPNVYLFSVNFLTKDKIKTQNFYSSEDYGGLFEKNFVAILQDDTTASAAEVISGVLKRRGLVFGDLTYGKPYIQSVFDVEKYTIIYTNAFLNFSLELRPHDKIKPDFYLSRKEIENKKILELFLKIYWCLKSNFYGG